MTRARTLLEPRRVLSLRWAAAGVLVVAVHGGVALALMHRPEEAGTAAAGAVIVEMVPAPLRPVDSPDVAHGPLAEEAQRARPATRKAEETRAKEPPVEASPAPEPDVALSKPGFAKTDLDARRPQDEQPARRASAAAVTAAPPRLESQTPPSVAPAPGTASQAERRLMVAWEKALVGHLNRFKRYPDAARSRGRQGVVHVLFTIDRAGAVLATRIVRSSGSAVLDGEAAAVLQRASPMPAPPAQFAGATFDLTLPIQFQIR